MIPKFGQIIRERFNESGATSQLARNFGEILLQIIACPSWERTGISRLTIREVAGSPMIIL